MVRTGKMRRVPFGGGGNDKEARYVYIRTFGYFDVFVDGHILDFPSKKGKELLAVLVDRKGGICTTEELITVLWENEPLTQTTSGRYRQTFKRLKRFLEESGAGQILVSKRGGKCIDTSRVTCDFYQYMKGDERYRRLFGRSYMTNYSWAETTLAMLLSIERKRGSSRETDQ